MYLFINQIKSNRSLILKNPTDVEEAMKNGCGDLRAE